MSYIGVEWTLSLVDGGVTPPVWIVREPGATGGDDRGWAEAEAVTVDQLGVTVMLHPFVHRPEIGDRLGEVLLYPWCAIRRVERRQVQA